jgi:uncharacterized protein (DUF58 family)
MLRWAGKLEAILTRDYAPRLEPAIRWMWTPLGTLGMAAIASFLCGLVLHPRGFVIFFGLLAVIGLGVVWPWLSVRGLSGTLSFDRERVREGETVVVRMSVRNRMPWDAWGLVVDAGFRERSRGDGPDGSASGLVRAPGWRSTGTAWEFVPERRGLYPLRTPRIATGFPFGIWGATRPLALSSHLLVWPRTFPVGSISEVAGGRDLDGPSLRDRPGPTGDILGVRPYRRGDSLRRIHWPQTARHDQLVVCEVQSRAVPRVQVILDLHDDAHAGSGPDGSREWAIRVAASFLERGIEQGAEVEAVFDGRTILPKGGSVGSRRARVLDELARIESNGFWTLDDLLDLPSCRLIPDGFRIIVTTDLGLRRLRRPAPCGPRDRLVVLAAAVFAGGEDVRESEAPSPSSMPSPWIWIDDPDRVPRCLLRKATKEVALGC